MNIQISNAEILDKLSILEIKLNKIKDKNKLINIIKELKYIQDNCMYLLKNPLIYNLYQDLQKTNKILWNIENKIRLKEKEKKFDQEFISLARSVYITNDKRAKIKKNINLITESNFIEEKSYEQY
jgi:hypothetical protein